MKVVRVLILTALCLTASYLSAAPAFAWYWPVLGFGPGTPGAPLNGAGGPSTILPGTAEWALQTTPAARLILPGYSYGESAFKNFAAVGRVPSLTGPGFGFPCSFSSGNVYMG